MQRARLRIVHEKVTIFALVPSYQHPWERANSLVGEDPDECFNII